MPEQKYTIDEHGERIEDFLDTLLDNAGFELDFDIVEPPESADARFEQPDLLVEFEGEDSDLLLANKAELLLAMEMLTLEHLRVPGEDHSRISFDCNDYRKLRIQELRMTAEAAADRVVHTRQPFAFNPLNSRERRVIHLALRDRTEVRSESASSIHGRYVVIYPSAMPTPAEPPKPPGPFAPPHGGRGDAPGGGRRGGDDRRGGRSGDDRRGRPRRGGGGGGGGRGPRRSG